MKKCSYEQCRVSVLPRLLPQASVAPKSSPKLILLTLQTVRVCVWHLDNTVALLNIESHHFGLSSVSLPDACCWMEDKAQRGLSASAASCVGTRRQHTHTHTNNNTATNTALMLMSQTKSLKRMSYELVSQDGQMAQELRWRERKPQFPHIYKRFSSQLHRHDGSDISTFCMMEVTWQFLQNPQF